MLNIHFYKIFLSNKYSKWYLYIISSALTENRKRTTQYFEAHHIIPKSLAPEFANFRLNNWNKVLLTPKEHFICHLLLTKMVTGDMRSKMIYALWHMRNQKNQYQERRYTSRLYNLYKKKMQEQLSVDRKGKTLEELHGPEKGSAIRAKFKERKTRGKVSDTERNKLSTGMKEMHQTRPWKRFMQTNGCLPKGTCPHCNKTMDVGNLGKYHNDKCKLRQISE